jgi:23S rRNA pseudouridine1911/1915/1917 synthase
MTGRTHQIRVHLFALEHPVMGDILYKLKKPPRKTEMSRLMLQSVALSFKDPASGRMESFRLDADPEFDRLTEELS